MINEHEINKIPTILTIKQFVEKHKFISYAGLQNQLFHRQTNGLNVSGAIIKLGKRVLINEEKFFEWLNTYKAKK
jgi:hypothetical protein